MLLKFTRPLVLLTAMLTLIGLAAPVQADDDEEPEQLRLIQDFLGVCGYYDLSGRWITGEDGEIIELEELCLARRASISAAIATNTLSDPFWDAFQDVASPTALAFAEDLERQDVLEYGATVCPLLESGNTMQDVRAIQVRGGLPASFDAAINVAAINVYCPEYRDYIGR